MKQDNQKSFTLLELLVVIAIIAILAGIVMVAVSDSRERAKQAKGLQFSQNIRTTLSNELVGEWTFDSNTIKENPIGSGIFYAQDTSGNGNHGRIYGDPQNPRGITRECLEFNGNDYIQIPNTPSLTLSGSNESVFLWVKHNNSDYIFFQSNGWSRRLFKNYWAFYSPFTTFQLGNSHDNNWHLVGYTASGQTIKSYLDGDLLETKNITLSSSIGYWWLGRICSGSTCDNYYNGYIDEVRIYNRALTAKEVQQLYAKSLPRHLSSK
ncbi:MAG: LamG domain-containing protein [Candidatus Pacebacteria bacterium]|nr:LamG domain-containing protein [Candidatus Paceibacterota bacterium]